MSYTGITNGIIGITDNGLNTAAEMRSLLTEMSLEYLPYSAGTKNVTLDKLYFSNVDVSLLDNASNKVVINKEYADANYLSSDLEAVIYQGTWDANTNSPTIPSSSSGNTGYYYVVNASGTTNVDGVTDWQIGDWIISNGTIWEKVDNTSPIVSVDGRIGVVTLNDLYAPLSGASTGLEAIDEGNGIGWRLIGRDATNYGNIGNNAVDLSLSTVSGETHGATGSGSFVTGGSNIANNTYSVAMGSTNTATGYASFTQGYGNTNSGQMSAVFGYLNNVVGTYSGVFGWNNTVNDGTSLVGGKGHTTSGAFNFAAVSITQFTVLDPVTFTAGKAKPFSLA